MGNQIDGPVRHCLRAAYIAVLLDILSPKAKDDHFGRGQLKILEVGLRERPISLTDDRLTKTDEYNELLDVVNAWFEMHFVETLRLFIKTANPRFGKLRTLIKEAIGQTGDDTSHLVDNWLIQEISESEKMNKEISQQLAKYLQ